jgi:hypothetical protein
MNADASAPARARGSYTSATLFIESALEQGMQLMPELAAFSAALIDATGISLRDIVDTLSLPSPPLRGMGWEQVAPARWSHRMPGFPDIEIGDRRFEIAVRVDDIERLSLAMGGVLGFSGGAYAPFRQALLSENQKARLVFVERQGRGFDLSSANERQCRWARLHLQTFRTRRRVFHKREGGLEHTRRLAKAAVTDLGSAWASSLFMKAEREYWARYCEAGAIQQRRQNQFGVGWCTIETYVYAASREHLAQTLQLFATLGYTASHMVIDGKGPAAIALASEASSAAVIVDVDLGPADLGADLIGAAATPLTRLGRAGRWCAMHGESLLDGGLCALAAAYDVEAVIAQLGRFGVEFAREGRVDRGQCFTLGEKRPINPVRINTLHALGHLSVEAAEQLRLEGAAGARLACVNRDLVDLAGLALDEDEDLFAPDAFASAEPRRRGRRRVKRASATTT